MGKATEEKLAMIAGGQTLRLQRSDGSRSELTSDDIRAALGFVTFDGKLRGIPTNRIGVHLVLARYTGSTSSYQILVQFLAEVLWMRFWHDCRDDTARVRKKTFKDVARILAEDYCNPGKFRNASDREMAKIVGVAPVVWKGRFKRLYGTLRTECSHLESPVIQALVRVIG